MLQRVQTLFLLGVILSMGAIMASPIWMKVDIEKQEKVLLDAQELQHLGAENQVMEAQQTYYILIPVVLSMAIALYSIFRYNNRMAQVVLNLVNIFVIFSSFGIMVYFMRQGEEMLNPDEQGEYQFGLILPMLALVFNSLANRFIRRDERLVKSVDRIR
jgi:hypothetical protein